MGYPRYAILMWYLHLKILFTFNFYNIFFLIVNFLDIWALFYNHQYVQRSMITFTPHLCPSTSLTSPQHGTLQLHILSLFLSNSLSPISTVHLCMGWGHPWETTSVTVKSTRREICWWPDLQYIMILFDQPAIHCLSKRWVLRNTFLVYGGILTGLILFRTSTIAGVSSWVL